MVYTNRMVSKLFQRGFPTCFLAALVGIGCGFLSTLHGGERILAYRDASGRVVFVNELPAEPSSPQPTTASKATAPVDHPKPSGSSRKDQHAEIIATTAAPAQPAPTQSPWNAMIEGTASRHQVDPDLVRAVVRVESNFNPFAVSSRGASGLMQLIPATARRFGVQNIFDPKANLEGGVRYLKYLMNLFGGNLKLSLAAYNAGENAVGRHNGVPPFPETQDYLRKISELYPLLPPKGGFAAGIEKYVDSNGIVHFSNTDLP